MSDERIDEQSWALLRDLWETPVGRRWVLKAGLGSAIAVGTELYGGRAAAAAKRLATGVAPADFHFRLGSARGVSDLVLVANGVRTPLARHTRTTHTKLRRSGGVWRAADLTQLTHYVSGIELPNDRPLLMTVLGRRGRLTVVVAQKWHIPAWVTSRLASATYRLSGSMAPVAGSPRRLHSLGIDAGRVRRSQHAVQLASVGGVEDTAFGLVSVHPNIATIAPQELKVTEDLLLKTPALDTLANHIESMQLAGHDYATYETARRPDGKPYEITLPASHGQPKEVTTFETFHLNDGENNKGGAELKRTLKSAVGVGITTVRDSTQLGAVIDKPLVDERSKSSRTWIQPEGVTPVVRNHTTALRGPQVDINIKNEGLNYGTYVARNGALKDGKVPLKVYNNWVRWVSVYVQYLGKDGKNLSLNPSAEYPDSTHAKSLGLMPQVFTILGVPLWDTNTIDVELEFPPGAHVARLLMCGLGADIDGNGWRQYFPADAYPNGIAPTHEVLMPSLMTGILTIGLTAFALAADIDVAATWLGIRKEVEDGIEFLAENGQTVFKTAEQIKVFFETGGAASTFALGTAETVGAGVSAGIGTYALLGGEHDSAKNIWNILLSLATVIPKILFSPRAGKFWIKIAETVLAESAAQKVIEAIPFIGQLLSVIAAVGDVATLAEVCAETIVAPWVIENEVTLTYDATVEIAYDPNQAASFPATARSWRLEALVEGALTLDPVTGSINEGGAVRKAPLSIKVAAPFGGKEIQWSVVFLDGAGRQVGTGVSAKHPNDDPQNPPSKISIGIKQLPAEITDKTVFKRQGTTTYDPAAHGYKWSNKVAPSGTVHDKGVQEVTDTAVATLAGVAGIVFKENDRFYIRGVPVAQDGDTIKLGTARKEGFARRPFLLLDPFVGPNDRKNHILLEPDEDTDGYHVRRLSLDPDTGDISWDPDVSLGTFTLPVSAAALHSTGKIVVVNTNRGRLGSLHPVHTPPRPQLASYVAGPGRRVGLLESPIAVAITNPGVVLVLEAGTAQIAAFDLNGNPVRYFKAPAGGELEYRRSLVSEGRPLDMAVDGSDQIYVLYVTGDGSADQDYRIDVYTKQGELFNRASHGTNIPRLAIDYWRSIFGANYDPLRELGSHTKRIDPRLGVAEPSLSRFDPT